MSQFRLLREQRFRPFFLTQFLGAFNDNLFKNALVVLLTFQAASWTTIAPALLANLAAGIFILPFFLFSAMAGQLADSPFDEATIEPLLNDTLKKLEADAVSREIDALNAQERERGLNATERRHLAELFVRKQKLQARTKAQDS